MRKRIRHPHPVWRIVRLVSGILLLLLGIVGGLLPVIQGWMFVIPALLLLAPESRLIRRIVVKMRTKLKLRRRRRRSRKAASGQTDGQPETGEAGGSQRERTG